MQLTALICTLAGALAQPGEVAFIDSAAGQGGAVFVMGVGGGEARQVGPGQQDGPPRWSPDGEWLAFETGTPGGRGLHVVRADGSGGRLVGTGPWCTTPAWATDSARLIYGSAAASGTPGQIRVLDLNSGEDSPWGNGVIGIVEPVWMPFNDLMLFLSPETPILVEGVDVPRFRAEARMEVEQIDTETPPEAFLAIRLLPDSAGDRPVIRTDLVLVSKSEVLPWLGVADKDRAARGATVWGVTPNWRKQAHGPEAAEHPEFGAYPLKEVGQTTRIAFESNEGGDCEIMVLVGKRGIVNVSNHRAADWNPVWSPDGDNLAFESFRGGTRGIYNVYTDTAHVTPLAADGDANCWSPAWSPDSQSLAFVSDRGGQAEIYRAGVTGDEWKRITTTGGAKAAPAWRPERK
jgi:Tol biopolymer transport system component